MESIGTPVFWVGFTISVLVLLILDLGVFHRKAHAVGFREALVWSVAWISLALLFNGWVYHGFGSEKGLEFLTGYLIELSLSVDNLFVFLVIFSYFSVPVSLQHRVLFWGILGAVVTRATFIFAGTALIQSFHAVIYVFGALLMFTGVKLLAQQEHEVHPERNPVLRLFRRWVPFVENYHGAKFVVSESGRRFATPLLAVLVVVEATDVFFAVDSIPAIFAITTDPFIVYTSNIFAILGLRSLFFLLAGMMGKFRYLRVGLALVLTFVGCKMVLQEVYKLPITISLAVVATLLAGSVAASLLRPPPVPVREPLRDRSREDSLSASPDSKERSEATQQPHDKTFRRPGADPHTLPTTVPGGGRSGAKGAAP
ncbi:MAG: TerC family protein [Nitrospirae bacterium]|nr:TerC family protein [Nitrospirota bacterium]